MLRGPAESSTPKGATIFPADHLRGGALGLAMRSRDGSQYFGAVRSSIASLFAVSPQMSYGQVQLLHEAYALGPHSASTV